MSVSSVRNLPSAALLALLVGDECAAMLAGRPLSELFSLTPQPPAAHEGMARYPATPALEAAKELMARALDEQLRARSCLNAPHAVRDLLRLRLGHLPHETFCVLLLDAGHHLIEVVELFRGTLTQTSVYPREVVKLALFHNAAAVILAHNHPSGTVEPSRADAMLTDVLRGALALVDVRVLDHFIVAGTAHPVSFAERGLL